jgi:hypothetical protein
MSVYEPSSIKRQRRSKAELEVLFDRTLRIVELREGIWGRGVRS